MSPTRPSLHFWHESTARNGKSDRTLKALSYVKGRETTTPLELSAFLDISANDAGTYLRRMYSDGLIDKVSRGVYKPVSSVSECLKQNGGNQTTDTEDTHTQTNLVSFPTKEANR